MSRRNGPGRGGGDASDHRPLPGGGVDRRPPRPPAVPRHRGGLLRRHTVDRLFRSLDVALRHPHDRLLDPRRFR